MHSGAQKKRPADEYFVERFTSRILDKCSGLSPEQAVLHGAAPRRMFFGAVLCGTRENQTEEERQLSERYRPTSCGLDFICRRGARMEVTLRLSFNVYGIFYQPFDTLAPMPTAIQAYLPTLSYERFSVENETGIDLSRYDVGMHELREVSRSLDDLLMDVSARIAERDDALRERDAAGPRNGRLGAWTAEAYASALFQGDKVRQTWKAAVFLHITETEVGKRVQIFLTNASVEVVGTMALDRNFYGTDVSIAIDRDVLNDIPLERAPLKDYRYRRSVIVQGINCNSSYDEKSGVMRTSFMPTFEQMRYLPLESYDLRFERVCGETDAVFHEIDEGLRAYAESWHSRLRIGELEIRSQSDLDIAQGFYDDFVVEAERIRTGMRLLRENADPRQAFLLMNATFKRIGDVKRARGQWGISGWYLFQFCFILSLLAPFVHRDSEAAENAYLLWFPTGGGKTEAVMGVVVFAMFYERLTGRAFGTTSWMRFPLRLLTFQQMQRYVDVVIAADEERVDAGKTIPELAAGATFTIGYFGGRRNSPNDLRRVPEDLQVPSELRNRLKSQTSGNVTGMDLLLDEEGRRLFQDLRIVTECFYCGADDSIEIVGDPTSLTMRHWCSSCEHNLPIYTIDDDIYTQLPTVIVGTLDKLATVGFRSAFRTLVGKSDGRCVKHGYGTFGKCLKSFYRRCSHADWKARRSAEPAYGGISILFQDELHLIHEQLGCFDAHYESLLISLCAEAGGKAPLIIAASATIEGADHQLEHLYEARLVRFPGEGPRLRDTFYARETQDLQRLYVGIKPSNLAHLDTTMSLIAFLFEEISLLRNQRGKMEQFYPQLHGLPEPNYQNLVDRHTLTVAYVNSKREGQNIYRSVDEQVRDNLRRSGADQIYGVTSLTGDSTMDDVKDALRRMKTRRGDLPDREKLDFAVATSMISHGVDVDRLNDMIFFSYPRSTAEYIQASSRAGRTYPGIVFVVLKNSTYRDRSFYRNFREIHEALDKMVETVPIDRFAVHAVHRTVPGLAVGTLINRSVDRMRKNNEISLDDAREIDNVQTLKRLVIGGLHFKDVVKDDLDSFYRVSDSRATDWRNEIARILDNLDTNISGVGERQSIPFELNHTETRVMTSLRDVDPPLEVLIRDRITADRGGEDGE
jgi:hypothetical protein